MTRAAFVIPGDLGLPTGGYAYDRRVLAAMPGLGVEMAHVALPGSYPAPTPADFAETQRLIAATRREDVLLIDGLAYGAMPAELVRSFGRRVVALVHHPLCLESGITPARATALKRSETEALALAQRVIVTSATTARTLISDFAVQGSRITIAEPGTDPAPRAKGSDGKRMRLLSVGSIVPRKGYDLLIEALIPLKALPWDLDIAGALDRSPETVAALRRQIAGAGLADRITLLGPVDEARLGQLYDGADIFVLASHYEGFGMVLTEALARGLAIVCTIGGAAAETLPDGAALKVEAGSPRALAWSIGRVMEPETGLKKRLSEAAWEASGKLPRWDGTAAKIAAVLKEVAQ